MTSPVKGVVQDVAEGLVEGGRVKQGDFIVEIPPSAANLEAQLKAQLQDLRVKLQTANVKGEVYARNVEDFGAARDFAVSAADEMVQAAKAKLEAKRRLVPGYAAKELQARLNHKRQKDLFEKGVKSVREVEIMKEEWDVAVAELESARLEVTAAEEEWEAKKHEREQKQREAQTKVDYARAMERTRSARRPRRRKRLGTWKSKCPSWTG